MMVSRVTVMSRRCSAQCANDQPLARPVQLDSRHQALATDGDDIREIAKRLLQAGKQAITEHGDTRRQVVACHDV
ncbi:hypothetical protein BBI09_04745 [Stutzerimonas xanthomarina]|nr:hypothetical protein BBI09_04745 [Stutzerimonas xanthomarina]